MKIRNLLSNLHIDYHHNLLFLIANSAVIICTILILLAILFDFVKYHHHQVSKKKINSWVETGTMFLYFFSYYACMKFTPGYLKIESAIIINLFIIVGILLVIIGCTVNLMGRHVLKNNWANQVTIYANHTLVSGSVYKLVRHPLYASLIWMLIGGSFIYSNFIALFSVLAIFIPMMYYRAKQEETLLISEFAEYLEYKQKVGMFFPKIIHYGKL